jgi:hypothetical protein
MSRIPVTHDVTGRGFPVIRFHDAYGRACSLQHSSLAAAEGHVWLGCDAANPVLLGPGGPVEAYPLRDDVEVTTRMHLSQAHVAALLPALTHFAETGELPEAEG